MAQRERVNDMYQGFSEQLARIDWSAMDSVHDIGEQILRDAAAPNTLRSLLDGVSESPELLSMAEHFHLFDKVVLYEDDSTTVRLRLHLFGAEAVEEAHNHRASFCALLLHGSYAHYLYGHIDHVGLGGPTLPEPLFAYRQEPGAFYALHHSMVHSTLARPGTISLMLQGPRDRDRFEILDLDTGQTRSRVGSAAIPNAQEAGEARLGVDDLADIDRTLTEFGLVA